MWGVSPDSFHANMTHFIFVSSNFLIAFSISIINSLIYVLGLCSRAYWGPKLNTLICSFVSVVLVRFIILGCVLHDVIVFHCLICDCKVSCLVMSMSSFLFIDWYLLSMILPILHGLKIKMAHFSLKFIWEYKLHFILLDIHW